MSVYLVELLELVETEQHHAHLVVGVLSATLPTVGLGIGAGWAIASADRASTAVCASNSAARRFARSPRWSPMRRRLNTTSATPKKYINDGGSIWVPSTFRSITIPPQSVTAMYATKQIEKITRTSMTSRPEDAVTENGMEALQGFARTGPLQPATLSERLHFFMNQNARSQSRLQFVYQACAPFLTRRSGARKPRTLTRREASRRFFRDHDHRQVRVGARHRRHDGGVGDTQASTPTTRH